MNEPFTLYSAAGSGGMAVEAALTILDLPYRAVEMGTWPQVRRGPPPATRAVRRSCAG